MARTAVAKAKIAGLPSVADMSEELARFQSRLSAPSGDRLTVTQDKLFKLPNGDTSDSVTCIIVDFVSQNSYYEQAYDRNNIVPPACFALGLNPTEMVPSNNSPDKQADACGACWANQFGSAGKGKACANTKLLAVMAVDAEADTPLMVLKVSATALRAFDSYVSGVVRHHQRPPRGVVTEITFDPNVDYPSLRFACKETAPDAVFALAHSRKDEALDRLLVEPDVSQVPPPAVKKPARAKARARA